MPKTHTFARLASAGQGRRLFLLSWMAYAAAYVGRYNYSAVMSAITAEGTLTLSAAGAVSTGYFVCYAAGQILCGMLSQKCSPFGMIPVGLALSAGCNFGMALAPAAMPALWAANGLFQAMVWPPIVRLFAECMPLTQQDSACVSINSTTPAGTLGAYALSAAALALAGWLDHQVFRNEVRTSAALMGAALVCLLALPLAVRVSLPLSVVLLAATTALMLGVNTMFINVMPVRIGRSSGAAVISGSLNAITYLGAAIATWGIGAAAEGFGWGAVFVLWAVMAAAALAVCLLLAGPWGRFALAREAERGERV